MADTGGYSEWNSPCYSLATHPTTGTCPNYDWRTPTRNVAGEITGWPEWSSRGYGVRNCTDYVASKLESLGVSTSLTRGRGNGGQWANSSAGVTLTNTPEVGDAGVVYGNPGHVVYIEDVRVVSGVYQVRASQYNASYDGTNSVTGWVAASNYSKYVDFNGVGAPLGTGATASPRIIALGPNGDLSVKEGALNVPWTLVNQGVVDYRASSNRIAILDANGDLWVKEGPLNAVWQQVASGVSPGNFAVTNDMVVVLSGTDLYTKVGSLGATWGLTLNPVQSFKVSASDHIAARMTDGVVLLQWGAVGAGWMNMGGGIDAYNVTDDTFAVMWGGYISLKQGSPYATWTTIMNPVTGFDISPTNHVAALMANSHLNVLWGTVGSGWTDVASGFDAYDITDTRVGVLAGGSLSIKDGSVGAAWTLVATSVTSFVLT